MVGLLVLPTEIRLMILGNLLISSYVSNETGNPQVWPYTDRDNLATSEEIQLLFPQILRTCKKLYAEGIPLLYSKNLFCMHAPTAADYSSTHSDGLHQTLRFLRGIGPSNAGLIRRITIGGGAGMLLPEQLQDCFLLANGLNELTVIALGPRCQAPYAYTLQYYLNVEAAVKGSLTELTEISSIIPNGFAPEGFTRQTSIIHLKFNRKGARLDGELAVNLEDVISHFRLQVRGQEEEWQKKGWNRKLAEIYPEDMS